MGVHGQDEAGRGSAVDRVERTDPAVLADPGRDASVAGGASADRGDRARGQAGEPGTQSVEVGTQFTSAIAGHITGIRFNKAATNTGTHTGTLWTASGTLLATGTFTNETTSGWQTLTFTTPIAITPGTTYIVSYHAPNGHYAADTGYFTTAYTAYPLTAPASTVNSGNGVFAYGASTLYPGSNGGGANYWVDPILGS